MADNPLPVQPTRAGTRMGPPAGELCSVGGNTGGTSRLYLPCGSPEGRYRGCGCTLRETCCVLNSQSILCSSTAWSRGRRRVLAIGRLRKCSQWCSARWTRRIVWCRIGRDNVHPMGLLQCWWRKITCGHGTLVGLTLVRAEMWVWTNESTSLLAELLEEVIYLI